MEFERLTIFAKLIHLIANVDVKDIVLMTVPQLNVFKVHVINSKAFTELGEFTISNASLVLFKNCKELMSFRNIFLNKCIDNPLKILNIERSMDQECSRHGKKLRDDENDGIREIYRCKNFPVREKSFDSELSDMQFHLKSIMFEERCLGGAQNGSFDSKMTFRGDLSKGLNTDDEKKIFNRKSAILIDLLKGTFKEDANLCNFKRLEDTKSARLIEDNTNKNENVSHKDDERNREERNFSEATLFQVAEDDSSTVMMLLFIDSDDTDIPFEFDGKDLVSAVTKENKGIQCGSSIANLISSSQDTSVSNDESNEATSPEGEKKGKIYSSDQSEDECFCIEISRRDTELEVTSWFRSILSEF